MGKGYLKKRRRDALKHRGPCHVEGCTARGVALHECLTCERLKAAEPFALVACLKHDGQALTKVKRHALIAHPVNILRVTAAALKGEKI